MVAVVRPQSFEGDEGCSSGADGGEGCGGGADGGEGCGGEGSVSNGSKVQRLLGIEGGSVVVSKPNGRGGALTLRTEPPGVVCLAGES